MGGDLFELLLTCPGLPEFNPMMLLHGEHKLQILRPIETGMLFFNLQRKLTLQVLKLPKFKIKKREPWLSLKEWDMKIKKSKIYLILTQ